MAQPDQMRSDTEKIGSLSVFKSIPAKARRQVLIGAAAAAALLCLLGAVFGWQRHGLSGGLVGGVSGFLLGILLGWFIGSLLERFIGSTEGAGKLEILLDQANSRYLLGDNVSGQVLLQSNMPLRSRGGQISLTCQGFFSHAPAEDTSEGVKLERTIEQLYIQKADVIPPGDLRRGSVQGFAFELPLPQFGLPTHHGYLCIIKWELHAHLVLDNEQPLEAVFELLVESQPVAIAPDSEYQSEAASRQAQLALSLQRAVYAEGETIKGKVIVTPNTQFKAEELRVVLLRVENTPVGDNKRVYIVEWDTAKGVFHGQRLPGGSGTTYFWLEGEDNLATDASYAPREPVSYPFSIAIPQEWRPSIKVEQGSVSWRLGVTLVVADEPDLVVFHEVFVHTCVPKVSELISPAAIE